MKIDLDEHERKARTAQATWWIRGRDTEVCLGYGTHGSAGLWLGVSNVDHMAANSPPVTLAFIARIRELEAALLSMVDISDHGAVIRSDVDEIRALVARGTVLP